jgi:hypothetical protein
LASHGSSSKIFLLALWLGCWHLVGGLPLSLSWRSGGNPLVPAAHAALDGVRNALLLIK